MSLAKWALLCRGRSRGAIITLPTHNTQLDKCKALCICSISIFNVRNLLASNINVSPRVSGYSDANADGGKPRLLWFAARVHFMAGAILCRRHKRIREGSKDITVVVDDTVVVDNSGCGRHSAARQWRRIGLAGSEGDTRHWFRLRPTETTKEVPIAAWSTTAGLIFRGHLLWLVSKFLLENIFYLYLLAPVQVCPLPEWVFEGFSLDTWSLDHLVEEKRQLPWMAPGTSVAGTGGAPGFHRGCGEAWHWCNSRDRAREPVTQQWGVKVGAACSGGSINTARQVTWIVCVPVYQSYPPCVIISSQQCLPSIIHHLLLCVCLIHAIFVLDLSLIPCCVMVAQNFFPTTSHNVTDSDYVPKALYPNSAICRWDGVTFWVSVNTHGLDSEDFDIKFYLLVSPVWDLPLLEFQQMWTSKRKSKKLESHQLSKIVPLADCSVLRQCHMCVETLVYLLQQSPINQTAVAHCQSMKIIGSVACAALGEGLLR